jgi:hypothetical protein
MHHDNRNATLGSELQHLIACSSSPDIVEHVRPCIECGGGNLNLLGIGAERQRWEHAAKSFNGGNKPGDLICR